MPQYYIVIQLPLASANGPEKPSHLWALAQFNQKIINKKPGRDKVSQPGSDKNQNKVLVGIF
jgi:hypothetical protein